MDLPPEAEEVASFFGQLIGTAYVENPTFCANFFEDFKQLLKDTAPEEVIPPKLLMIEGVCGVRLEKFRNLTNAIFLQLMNISRN